MEKNRILSDSSSRIPLLSVVVITVYDTTHLSRCLTALMNQVVSPDMEIIVVYHEKVNDISRLKEKFPAVQFYCARGKQTQDKMLALGIQHSRGKVVALTVDHCTPEEHWCANIIKAHTAPYAALGGALEFGAQPGTVVNWAVHLYDYCSYGYYQNPVRRGPACELSDCNVSYKREILDRMANHWANGFHVPLMNRLLLAYGEKLWFSPDLLVYQHRDIDFLSAARIAYKRGRAFASARLLKFTIGQRVFYMIFSPFLPVKLLGKLLLNVLPKRSHLNAFVCAFPLIVLFSILWSLGEFFGFLNGRAGDTILVTQE